VPVIGAICEALVHIHERGWVHGDLKPSNVLLMADGSVRLADFGLARELEGTHAYAPRVGSSDFLPPEWWSERISERGIAVRPTVDIWALGVTIHQLLTGGLHPFPGAEPRARAAAAQAYADGRAPLRLADELPPEWRPIVADCLAPDHASRLPHTAASILARIPGRERPRHRTAWAAAGAAAAVAAGVALVLTVTVVGHVRHGDRLMTDCYVSGATTVTAEDKRSSDRWYRVGTRAGEAWLPAVRLAPSAPPRVPRCRE
jgi:eukaryotic-like serine/threonine-protein kinase